MFWCLSQSEAAHYAPKVQSSSWAITTSHSPVGGSLAAFCQGHRIIGLNAFPPFSCCAAVICPNLILISFLIRKGVSPLPSLPWPLFHSTALHLPSNKPRKGMVQQQRQPLALALASLALDSFLPLDSTRSHIHNHNPTDPAPPLQSLSSNPFSPLNVNHPASIRIEFSNKTLFLILNNDNDTTNLDRLVADQPPPRPGHSHSYRPRCSRRRPLLPNQLPDWVGRPSCWWQPSCAPASNAPESGLCYTELPKTPCLRYDGIVSTITAITGRRL